MRREGEGLNKWFVLGISTEMSYSINSLKKCFSQTYYYLPRVPREEAKKQKNVRFENCKLGE